MTTPNSGPPAGWHSRATLIPADSVQPSKEDFALAVVCSAMGRPFHLLLALFAPDRAIDARGRALQLDPADYAAFLALMPAESTHWRVHSAVTCRPGYSIITPTSESGVYNWNLRSRELDGGGELPEHVWTLIKEAHEKGLDDDGGVQESESKANVMAVRNILQL
ncbi:hypothetical protein AURDEDRAFT_116972 [Auricularia subglabra TFB-10046 SS5]|uniref:Uncharacterized protein n=1 Tax=Auricularia subglabra (strain TFB-10046 / SS5) TaxID=717982 RepID=J0DA13_AURST|nr:hypothetical protein AURDEDRAFT_116972 [Auricularia subglabra TFB-10046 SS5]